MKSDGIPPQENELVPQFKPEIAQIFRSVCDSLSDPIAACDRHFPSLRAKTDLEFSQLRVRRE